MLSPMHRVHGRNAFQADGLVAPTTAHKRGGGKECAANPRLAKIISQRCKRRRNDTVELYSR
ncbi:MAG: hypothetical protein HY22_10040 [[Candidatus Thermochlorobacteriaceae] bacterium GBChlB]|nr:MAG: hypothetical protein HY22_10040 [[Candidatus Thermochlorobacteriaceae] bacterium GBChlB]